MWQVQSTRNKRPALVPKRCCGLQATETARQFNASWDSDIQLLRHDCHHHTADLVRVLTGQKVDVSKLFPLQQNTVWM